MTDNAPLSYQRNKTYKKKGMIISSINVYGLLKILMNLSFLWMKKIVIS